MRLEAHEKYLFPAFRSVAMILLKTSLFQAPCTDLLDSRFDMVWGFMNPPVYCFCRHVYIAIER